MSSEMENPAIGVKHRLMHHLRERRVREHRLHELGLGRLQRPRDGEALDQLRHLRADHVGAEKRAAFGVDRSP